MMDSAASVVVVVVVVTLVALLLCCCLPAAGSVAHAAAGTTTAAAAGTTLPPTKSNGNDICRYFVTVKTGDRKDAGTDAEISVRFTSAEKGDELYIESLAYWVGHKEDLFETGSLDTLQVFDRCMREDICFMHLMSDGSGNKPGWYVDYVRIEGDYIAAQQFDVYQWLALDEPPYHLYATKDLCGVGSGAGDGAATM